MPILRGLYAITAAGRADDLPAMVDAALQGGARAVQYRDKSSDATLRLQSAGLLSGLCQAAGVPLIINDDIELAAETGAAGVHLGRHDASLPLARQRLGPNAIIGISCYNRFELASDAVAAGADYVAFGSFYPSLTKPEAVPATLQLIQRAKQELGIPVVAIGGITPENAPPLINAGADMLAVIQGVFSQPDIRTAAAAFAALFEQAEEST